MKLTNSQRKMAALQRTGKLVVPMLTRTMTIVAATRATLEGSLIRRLLSETFYSTVGAPSSDNTSSRVRSSLNKHKAHLRMETFKTCHRERRDPLPQDL